MATIVIEATTHAQGAEELPVARTTQLYAANHDSAERADPPQEMQDSGVRLRGVEGGVSRIATRANDSTTETANVPLTEAAGNEQAQGR